MSSKKTLEELIQIATLIVDRIEVAGRAELTADEVLALNAMKNQVEIIVTDLMDLHTKDPVPTEEVQALQDLLIKLLEISGAL